jgi:hypothetical protein
VSFFVHITGHFVGVDRHKAHATKARFGKSRRKTYDALCGARVKPLAFETVGQQGGAVTGHITTPWPPYAADAMEWGYVRCRDCLAAAPGKPKRLPLLPRKAA